MIRKPGYNGPLPFLLTWNYNHLANANKFRHIQQVNILLGLYVPSLVTPLELLSEEE